MGQLINTCRIPGLHLLISSLPYLALRTHVELLDIKRHSPSILYLLECLCFMNLLNEFGKRDKI